MSATLDDTMRAHILDALRATNWVVAGPTAPRHVWAWSAPPCSAGWQSSVSIARVASRPQDLCLGPCSPRVGVVVHWGVISMW